MAAATTPQLESEYCGENDSVPGLNFGSTVKAPNFASHGNVGPLFQKGLLSLKCVKLEIEENKSCRKTIDLQNRFLSFSVHDSSKEATELSRKTLTFP
jgi:hypothetical protein